MEYKRDIAITNETLPIKESAPKSDVGFFVELHSEMLQLMDPKISRPEALRKVISKEVCEVLNQEKWGLCLGTLDLDGETASIVKDINKSFPNIPFVMWVIGIKNGYWTNKANVPETIKKTRDVISWINYHDLQVSGLGFDSELPMKILKELSNAPLKGLPSLISHLLQVREYPEEVLEDFLSQLTVHEGINTEAYLCFRPIDKFTPRMEQAGKKFSMLYPTEKVPRNILNGILRVPNSFPAFGDVTTLKDLSGEPLSSGKPIGPFLKLKNPDDIVHDIESYAKSQGFPSSLRIFSLTGLEVVKGTQKGLKTASELS